MVIETPKLPMKVTADYRRQVIRLNGRTFPITAIQKFLIENYPGVVQAAFLNAVVKRGVFVKTETLVIGGNLVERKTLSREKVEFQYDWKDIFFRCSKMVVPFEQFLKSAA